jgi:hypothetical protein
VATPTEVQTSLFVTPYSNRIIAAVNVSATLVDYQVMPGFGSRGGPRGVRQTISDAAATQATNINAAMAAYR